MISWFDLWNRIALRNSVVVGEIRRQRYCENHARNVS